MLTYHLSDSEKEYYMECVQYGGVVGMPQAVLSMPHLPGKNGLPRDPEKEPEYFARCRAIRQFCQEEINRLGGATL